MDMEKTFHMTGGDGETSYTKNSSIQKIISDMAKHITKEAIEEVYYLLKNPKNITIADLGCSSGTNALSFVRDLYQTVEDAYHKQSQINGDAYHKKSQLINGSNGDAYHNQSQINGSNGDAYHNQSQIKGSNEWSPPKLSVYLIDLPSNDFNSVFKALPELNEDISGNLSQLEGHNRPSLFVAATSGSFYGRLFHANFLDLVHSSFAVHWLTKVPPGIYDSDGRSMNKGCIYICEKSPKTISKAYEDQFQEDFSRFLSLRSQEVKKGGKMVLIFQGREGSNHVDRGSSFEWQLLAKSFSILISQGLVEEEKLNSYDIAFYVPCKEEIEEMVKKEGSFKLDILDMLFMNPEEFEEKEIVEGESYGMTNAKMFRAFQEPMISPHFGEHILDSLFETFAHLYDQEMSKQEIRPLNFLLVLTKL